jgi:nitroimidazol reductase NimA-like FMN-containing flavoprotein (pyridoxamine 5'-phosphate oxidase superfamily)
VAGPSHRDSNGLEVLDREDCLRLLATRSLGRIGLTSSALPTILPVNYWFDGQRILVRTSPGTKLHAAAAGAVVAFEVDEVDAVYHAGWSVVVTGPAAEITDPDELDEIRHLPLPHWSAADGHVIAIDPAIVSGRRLEPGHGDER